MLRVRERIRRGGVEGGSCTEPQLLAGAARWLSPLRGPATAAQVQRGANAKRAAGASWTSRRPLRDIPCLAPAPGGHPDRGPAAPTAECGAARQARRPAGDTRATAPTLAAPEMLLNFDAARPRLLWSTRDLQSGISTRPDPEPAGRRSKPHIVEDRQTAGLGRVQQVPARRSYGPGADQTPLWSGFRWRLPNETTTGDGTVPPTTASQDRWVIQQFFRPPPLPYPRGAWRCQRRGDPNRCVQTATPSSTPSFRDYPKLAVWPDAYYVDLQTCSWGTPSPAAKPAALDPRPALLAGAAAATEQCFNVGHDVRWPPALRPSDGSRSAGR